MIHEENSSIKTYTKEDIEKMNLRECFCTKQSITKSRRINKNNGENIVSR